MKSSEFVDDFRKKIDFFSEKAIFEQIKDSNSGAVVWKVNDKGHDYILKMMDRDSFNLNNFIEIAKMYKSSHVKSINLIDYGFIKKIVYVIYDFIDGKPLNSFYDVMAKKSFGNFGLKIGMEYALINRSFFDKIIVRDYDISVLTNEVIKDFLNLYNNKLNYLQEIFGIKDIEILTKRLEILGGAFVNEKKVIIHSDMHPKNIVLSRDNELFIIDIDATAYDYFAMNFRYSLMAAFKKDENKEFFRGFINGFYSDKVPTIFYQQLLYVLILNFMEHIILFSKVKEKNYIEEYSKMVKKAFDDISILDDDIYNNDKLVSIFN